MAYLKKLYLISLTVWLLFASDNAFAVPPPDFIIQVASQIGSFFAVGLALTAGIFSISMQFVRGALLNRRKKFWIVSVVIILAVSGIGAYAYDQYYRSQENERLNSQWLQGTTGFPYVEPDVNPSPENKQDASSFVNFPDWNPEVPSDSPSMPMGNADSFATGSFATGSAPSATTFFDASVSPMSATPVTASGTVAIIVSASGVAETSVTASGSAVPNTLDAFYALHGSTEHKISNSEFSKRLAQAKGDYVVLDAREDLEYDLWHFPGSTHIRFADIKAGLWENLPKDKFVYVLCWSWMRGKEVAEYLDSKRIVAKYLEAGANGWVAYGGKWEGKINFNKVYDRENYRVIFTPKQIGNYAKSGVVFVDSKEPEKYALKHLDNAISVPIMSTPTADLDRVFSQIPKGSRIIVSCNAYVNCFDAKLTGIEFEKRGVVFLGRYWES